MCDNIGRLLCGVCGVCPDRCLLVDLLRKENEAVARRKSLCVALQSYQITVSPGLCPALASLFSSQSDCLFLSHYSRPVDGL